MDLTAPFPKLNSVYIPFDDWKGIGGPHTFMGNLKRELDRRGISLCQSFQDCDLMLFPIEYELEMLRHGRAQGRRFIVRLDGIWYPEKHGDSHRGLNRPIKEIYDRYADLVIFQSDYCRKQCFEMFGEKPSSEYRIILNGADFDLFYPNDGDRELSDSVQFITTGNFRDRAMIEPLVTALDKLTIEKHFRLHVVGPVQADLLPWLKRDYIVSEGKKSVAETAALLRQADIFLYSHLNPPCPNSVIEAISSGIPVVGFESGSMSELLPFSRELLAPAGERIFQRYQDFDAEKLREKIELAVNEFLKFKQLARQHAKDYPFIHCADQYLDAISEVAQRPTPHTDKGVAGWVHGRLGRLVTKVVRRLK